jgi:hypothetical protein
VSYPLGTVRPCCWEPVARGATDRARCSVSHASTGYSRRSCSRCPRWTSAAPSFATTRPAASSSSASSTATPAGRSCRWAGPSLPWRRRAAPLTSSPGRRRRRRRGYDQAAVLAGAVARALGAPASNLLARAPGSAQTGRSGVERLQGPSFAPRRSVGGSVLLVDDVVTTGTTMAAAATTLRHAGARHVRGVALAYRPRTRGRADP